MLHGAGFLLAPGAAAFSPDLVRCDCRRAMFHAEPTPIFLDQAGGVLTGHRLQKLTRCPIRFPWFWWAAGHDGSSSSAMERYRPVNCSLIR